MLLCTTNDNEMTKKKRGLHLKTLLFPYIYIYIYIYIGFKLYKRPLNYHPRGDLISHPCFDSLKFWKQLRWINIKLAKQVGIKSLN